MWVDMENLRTSHSYSYVNLAKESLSINRGMSVSPCQAIYCEKTLGHGHLAEPVLECMIFVVSNET